MSITRPVLIVFDHREREYTSFLFTLWVATLRGGDPTRTEPPNFASITTALQLSNLAINHGCDPNSVLISKQQNLIQGFIGLAYCFAIYDVENDMYYLQANHHFHLSTSVCRDLFSSMVGMGCELEGRNNEGFTAFLCACLLSQTNTMMALINIGADANATANNGKGTLHCSILGNEKRPSASLYRGLLILLTNKVDPNRLDHAGYSPSDYARKYSSRLDTWLEAVKDAGYEIIQLKLKHVNHGLEEYVWVVVSAEFEFSPNSTLPISNTTLREWLEERSKRQSRLCEYQPCQLEILRWKSKTPIYRDTQSGMESSKSD